MFDIIDKAAEKFIEKFFLGLIDPFDREELEQAIKDDVNLLDETMKFNPGALALAENMAKRFNGQARLLTTENVLKWIKEKRYELYFAFVSDKKTYRWLDRQIKEFKEFLFNY
jgi:two-component SAPR family response regulator